MSKRVLMMIPTLSGGGAERVVSNLSLQLNEKYKITILLDYEDITYPYSGNVIIVNSDSTISQKMHRMSEVYTYIKKYHMLKRMKKNNEYDVYISHSDISHILNLLTGNKKCRIIITLHNSIENIKTSRIGKIIKFFVKYFYKRADRIVAVSHGVAEEYRKIGNLDQKKLTFIWNGSDVDEIARKANETLPDGTERWFTVGRTITTMGRLTPQKGQIHLIKAFAKVVEEFPDCRLLLLGNGELQKPLESLVEELGLKQKVIFCGFQKNPFTIIGASDLFVFSSLWEGFGYALAEAICCGVPCITTDFKYGAREILHYNENEKEIAEAVYTDYGVLVPVCNSKQKETENIMADTIISVLKNHNYRKTIVENNSKRLEEFSLENMAKKWSEVIG